MVNRRINLFLLMGLIGTLAIGAGLATDLYRAFWGERGASTTLLLIGLFQVAAGRRGAG